MRFLLGWSNGISANGIVLNGLNAPEGAIVFAEFNKLFRPNQFSQVALGENWIDPKFLGAQGVGNISSVSGIKDNVMDNRFITDELKTTLCQGDSASTDSNGTTFRDYFSALIEVAWPPNAEFWLCCSGPAGKNATAACSSPDHIFSSKNNNAGESNQEGNFEPLILAPHFLTEKFESGQQEALTAAIIAKFNTQGLHLKMDLTGRFDLGAGGTRLISDRNPEFEHYLGNAWGNMFLDCDGDDADHNLCLASAEVDRSLGRDTNYYSLPLFTCTGGERSDDYPTFESGKACFSKDMATNIQDGCGFVAAAGPCDEVCVGGFCGVNVPPTEGQGTTNVLYVYMSDFPTTNHEKDNNNKLGLKIALPILSFFLVFAAVYLTKKYTKTYSPKIPFPKHEDEADKETSTDKDDDQDVETLADD
jgi:hypothetical protein